MREQKSTVRPPGAVTDVHAGLLHEGRKKQAAVLEEENRNLRLRLEEAEEILRALRGGELDALLIEGRVYLLEGAETPYRVLVEAMNEGAATLADDGTILYCNRQLGELLGVPLQQLIGSSFLQLLRKDQQAPVEMLLTKGRQELRRAEILFDRPDTDPLPLQLTLSPIEVHGAHAICVVATDLSERKRAEEARYASTLASMGDGVIATDNRGCVIILNAAATDLTGWAAREAAGQPVETVLKFVDEESRPHAFSADLQRVARGETASLSLNTCVVRRNGERTPVSATITPVQLADGGPRPRGVVLVLRDMTEHRKMESALRGSLKDAKDKQASLEEMKSSLEGTVTSLRQMTSKLESTVRSLGILVATSSESRLLLDHEGQILCASARAAQMLRSTPDGLKGTSAALLVEQEELLTARLAYNDFLHHRASPAFATIKLRPRDGEAAWYALKVSQVSLGQNEGFLVDLERLTG